MLQNLRENLKGTVAFIFIAVVVGAMVLIGVESVFVSSISGNSVAKVNGEEISHLELQREIEIRKAQMQERFNLQSNDERLSDDNLREPSLNSIMQRKAIVQVAVRGGMAVDDQVVKKQIVEGFTREGKFDRAFMNNYMSHYGFTPATFSEAEENNYILRQLANGVINSAFMTEKEIELFASLVGQKRSFFSLTLSKKGVESTIDITEAEVSSHYEANREDFREQEKVSLDYIEVSIDDLALKSELNEQEIRDEYEEELAGFETKTDYEVAHILIENTADSELAKKKVAEVTTKLEASEDFAQLAKEYSDDLGSKGVGGSLGLMKAGVFPPAFEQAVYSLEEGKVSAAVKTDSGIHFIKLVKKEEILPPTYEERKESITAALKRAKAQEQFSTIGSDLERETFGQPDLATAAKSLGFEIKNTGLFARNGGSGIASNKEVYSQAFGKEVFEDKQNSPLIELSSDRAVIIRLKEYKQSYVRPLADVKQSIHDKLTSSAIREALLGQGLELEEKIKAGILAKDLVEEGRVTLSEHELIDRTAVDADRTVLTQAFSMPRPSQTVNPVLETTTLQNGDVVVVGLTEVQDSTKASIEEAQLAAMSAQLKRQVGSDDYASFEKQITSTAKFSSK